MTQETLWLMATIYIGVGATVVMDLWALILKHFFGIPSLNYGLVGRWLGHFPKGQFAHKNIAQTPAVRGEQILGWAAHYAIGVGFAGLLLAIWGVEWARQPSLLPALIIGVCTVVMPFFVMQPSFGMGIAAAKTPKPNTIRLRSLGAHTVFGLGLYIAAILFTFIAQ